MQDPPGIIARPRELLFVCAAAVALAILMTWPLATGLGHMGRTLSTDGDGQYSIWNVAWVARTLVADPIHLFDANIFFPHRTTLAYSEANLLEGALGVPVYWLTRNPLLTLNVVLLFAFASAYVCAYLFLRYITGDRRAAAVAAILYAFCPYVLSHLSHIQLLMTGGIPLSLLMLHRVVDLVDFRLKAEARDQTADALDRTAEATDPIISIPVASAFRRKITSHGVALGLALAAQALSCAYYGIYAGLMVGYATLIFATTRRLWKSSPYWLAIAAAFVTSIAIVLPFFLPYLRVQDETGFRRTLDDALKNSATLNIYLASAARSHAWLLAIARRYGPVREVLFPGVLALVLGAAGLVLAARGGRRDHARWREREAALLYGSLAAIAFWASFGPAAGLYRVLFHLPTFSLLRAPARFGLVVVFGLTVLAAIALRHLFDAIPGRGRNLAAAVACAAAIADVTVIPIRWYRAPDVPSPYAELARRPRGPVAEFPFYGERKAFPLHTQYMLFSTLHWMPLVNGYSDVIPRDFREAAVVLDSFPSSDVFKVLARYRVRYIAVHWDMFGPRQDEIRRRLTPYAANLMMLASDDRMTLYEVIRYP